jgi:uncharacterized repeat protein (TIGR01451 family)
MAPDDVERLFSDLPPDRRQFLVRLLTGVGIAYVAPVVASFSLDGLVVPAAGQSANICAMSGNCGSVSVAIEKTALPTSVHPGETITYQIAVQSCTSCYVSNLVVRDPIPPGTTFVSAQQLSGSAFTLILPNPGDGPPATFVAAAATPLALGDAAVFEVVVQVDEP